MQEAVELLTKVQEQISMYADLLLQFTDKSNAEIKCSTLFRIGENLDDCNQQLDIVHNKLITA